MIELNEWTNKNFPKLEYGTQLKDNSNIWVFINNSPPIIERDVYIKSAPNAFVRHNNCWVEFDNDLIDD